MCDEVIVVVLPSPFEYWCGACGQLRLCFDPERTHCGCCGAEIILWGAPGELNAEELREGLICENGHWVIPPYDPNLPGKEVKNGESREAPRKMLSEKGF